MRNRSIILKYQIASILLHFVADYLWHHIHETSNQINIFRDDVRNRKC